VDKEDSWVWKDDATTTYTVKSACDILKEDVQVDERDLFQSFWRIKAQPSSHLTIWRILEDKITSKANLARRGVCMTDNIYCVCGEEEENTSHFSVRVELSGLCGLSVMSGWGLQRRIIGSLKSTSLVSR